VTTPSRPSASAYSGALAALQGRGRFGIRLGLGRTRGLLRALGEPQLGLRGALIGGTNGKGSVQALVASVLRASGQRVGQTPKPHLVSYRERLAVDGRPIPADDFATLVGEVLVLAESLPRRLGPPTEFEVLTAAAFEWFRRCRVDVGVVEVGLGGRLDATNAWDAGVAAITNVELDHMDRLGPTRERIAREKAAIIKRGALAVTGASEPGLGVIRRRAARLGVRLVEVAPLPVVAMDRGGLTVRHPDLGELRLGLLGRHQAANAAVALAVVEALREQGIAAPSPADVRRGVEATRWPGRLELLAVDREGRGAPAPTDLPDPERRDVLLDGAHNEAGVAALVDALAELRPTLSPGRPTLLLALMGDKDVVSILGALAGAEPLRDARIITTAVDAPRAMPPAELADAWRDAAARRRGSTEVSGIDGVPAALDAALHAARGEGGPLVVAGSLYLVGDVRGALIDDPELRDP
jgi:dihydrofolate synthase/folylpolyglutamate synthase